MFDKHFVALMQIYLTSHAIHQAKDDDLVDSVRRAHSDILDRYNARDCRSDDPDSFTAYEDVVREKVRFDPTVGADRVWDVAGFLGDLSGADVSTRTHDDRVMRYCFAAQVLYAFQDADADKDQIAMSVLRGRVSPDLRDDLREYVTTIVEGLRTCPDYQFRVYWGFPETQHMTHIAGQHWEYYWGGGDLGVFRHAAQPPSNERPCALTP